MPFLPFFFFPFLSLGLVVRLYQASYHSLYVFLFVYLFSFVSFSAIPLHSYARYMKVEINTRDKTPLFRSRNNFLYSLISIDPKNNLNLLNLLWLTYFPYLSNIRTARKKKGLHKPEDSILENKRRNNWRGGEEDGQGWPVPPSPSTRRKENAEIRLFAIKQRSVADLWRVNRADLKTLYKVVESINIGNPLARESR